MSSGATRCSVPVQANRDSIAADQSAASTDPDDSVASDLKSALLRMLAGMGIHICVSSIPLLTRAIQGKLAFRKVPERVLRSAFGRRALHVGLWAASFGLAYRLAKRAKLPPTACGALSGLTVLLLLPLKDTYFDPTVLSLHAAVRAGAFVARRAIARGELPRWSHLETVSFVLSCWVIMYSWFYHPRALPAAYNRWITTMADMDGRLLHALRLLKSGAEGGYGDHHPVLRSYCQQHGLDPKEGDPLFGFISHQLVHPEMGTNWRANSAARLARAFLAALAINVPVQLLAVLVAKGPGLVRRPSLRNLLGAVLKVARGAARSSLFIGLFVCLVWTGVSVTRATLRDDTVAGPSLGSLLCGLSVLLEPRGRRQELACYVAPRALQTLWARAAAKGWLPASIPAMVAPVLMAAACAVALPSIDEELGRGARRGVEQSEGKGFKGLRGHGVSAPGHGSAAASPGLGIDGGEARANGASH